MAEDAVGVRGDNVIESTADLLKTNAFKGKLARFYQTYGVEYKAWAKENNIPQSSFEKLANAYADMNEQEQQSEEDFIKDEKQKLGNNAENIIEGTIQWGKGLVAKGVLTDDDYKELENWGGTAEGIRLLGKFRQMMGEKEITTTPVEGAQLDKDELQALVADPRYGNDMRFTRDLELKFQEAFSG